MLGVPGMMAKDGVATLRRRAPLCAAPPRRGQEGIALVLVLWLTVLLTVIAGGDNDFYPVGAVPRGKGLELLLCEGAKWREVEHPLSGKGCAHRCHLTDKSFSGRGRRAGRAERPAEPD